MSAKKHEFPEEKFGPKLLAFVTSHNKHRCTRWGPDLDGLKLKGRGMDWVIRGTFWSGFTAYTPDEMVRWQGKFKDAEEFFDL